VVHSKFFFFSHINFIGNQNRQWLSPPQKFVKLFNRPSAETATPFDAYTLQSPTMMSGANATNWRIHMFRRTFLAATAAASIMAAPAFAGGHSKDIVDTAVEAGTFTTLAAALTAAGLVDTLKGEGPFTVFAPTDEAFAALPEGTVETLLKPENKDQLTAILTYHVVAGKVMSTDLTDGMMAATVEGSEVKIDLTDGVKVNDATVTAADIEASNGVIHVIDKVIMPAM
jgi:uncharacterized surface protein with fasciclin (FAS1) repeats